MREMTRRRRHIYDICVFAMLGTLMFVSKLLLEFLPNIHLLGALTMVYTLAFRRRALIPIYIYVMLNGIWAGFDPWWVPYTYIWALLWGATMLLPKDMPDRVAAVVYTAVCGAHGILFGVLYAPAYAIMWNLDFKGMVAWIVAGFGWDAIHMVGNIGAGLLVLPLYKTVKKLYRG